MSNYIFVGAVVSEVVIGTLFAVLHLPLKSPYVLYWLASYPIGGLIGYCLYRMKEENG